MHLHGSEIARDKSAAGIGGNVQNARIVSAIGKNAGSALEIDSCLPPPQSLPDVGINIGVGLKSELQAGFTDISFFARSNFSIMSAGIGC